MSSILMITVFYKAVISKGEIWRWSLLGLKGLILLVYPTGTGFANRFSFVQLAFWKVINVAHKKHLKISDSLPDFISWTILFLKLLTSTSYHLGYWTDVFAVLCWGLSYNNKWWKQGKSKYTTRIETNNWKTKKHFKMINLLLYVISKTWRAILTYTCIHLISSYTSTYLHALAYHELISTKHEGSTKSWLSVTKTKN